MPSIVRVSFPFWTDNLSLTDCLSITYRIVRFGKDGNCFLVCEPNFVFSMAETIRLPTDENIAYSSVFADSEKLILEAKSNFCEHL